MVPLVRAFFPLGILWRSCAAYFSGVAFVGYCYEAYKSASETLKRSRLLKNNTRKMREEVAKYRTNLEIMKMRPQSVPLIVTHSKLKHLISNNQIRSHYESTACS